MFAFGHMSQKGEGHTTRQRSTFKAVYGLCEAELRDSSASEGSSSDGEQQFVPGTQIRLMTAAESVVEVAAVKALQKMWSE
eukprot:gene4785-11044_t